MNLNGFVLELWFLVIVTIEIGPIVVVLAVLSVVRVRAARPLVSAKRSLVFSHFTRFFTVDLVLLGLLNFWWTKYCV